MGKPIESAPDVEVVRPSCARSKTAAKHRSEGRQGNQPRCSVESQLAALERLQLDPFSPESLAIAPLSVRAIGPLIDWLDFRISLPASSVKQ
jgi:hypothetical protein